MKSQTIKVEEGTKLDFNDTNVLSKYGIEIPSGYKFRYSQSKEIMNDWNGYDSITIPTDSSSTRYLILVFVAKTN